MNKQQQNTRLQWRVLLVSILLLMVKWWAYYVTQSNTILTDASESVVNVIAGSFALYALFLTAIPQDENHPYGHGKIEFISASIEGFLILLAGGAIILKSIYSLFYPQDLHQLDVGILLSGVTGAVNYVVGFLMEKQGRTTHSMTLMAGGKHLKSDAYSTLGVILGLTVVFYTKIYWLDSVIAIGFGGFIMYTGISILKKSVAGIMDEVDPELVAHIASTLNEKREQNWVDIHNLRIIKYGSRLHIDCHLTLPAYFTVQEAHHEVDTVESLISAMFDVEVEVFIHTDFCMPHLCSHCSKELCPIRTMPFDGFITWTSQNISLNQKHGT